MMLVILAAGGSHWISNWGNRDIVSQMGMMASAAESLYLLRDRKEHEGREECPCHRDGEWDDVEIDLDAIH